MLLVLHGAMSSAAALELHAPTIEALWATGELPPAIVGCASTPTQGGFYIDWPDGPAWETVVEELPAHLVGADPARRAVIGASMGGYGALELVLAHAERYVAAAALSPAVFPGDTAATVPEANRVSVLGELLAAIEASPADALSTRLTANAAALRAADGPAVFIAVGDRDDFRLHDRTEHLHRARCGTSACRTSTSSAGAARTRVPRCSRCNEPRWPSSAAALAR
jgi:S-formylglutathione hydrolase